MLNGPSSTLVFSVWSKFSCWLHQPHCPGGACPDAVAWSAGAIGGAVLVFYRSCTALACTIRILEKIVVGNLHIISNSSDLYKAFMRSKVVGLLSTNPTPKKDC